MSAPSNPERALRLAVNCSAAKSGVTQSLWRICAVAHSAILADQNQFVDLMETRNRAL
jgi:hypothetical protein